MRPARLLFTVISLSATREAFYLVSRAFSEEVTRKRRLLAWSWRSCTLLKPPPPKHRTMDAKRFNRHIVVLVLYT